MSRGRSTIGTFDSAGVPVRYVRAGAGEPLVLIHGFSLDSELNWIEPGTFDRLASRYDVVALDMRGHGRSGKPHDAGSYGFEMARDVTRLLDHLEIDRAHVAGYSMGAAVTLQLVVASPERLRKAILAGQGWRPPASLASAMGGIHEALAAGRGFATLLQAIEGPDAPRMSRRTTEQWEERLEAINDQQALAAVLAGAAGSHPITEDDLRANRVPSLAVIGEQDFMLESVRQMAEEMSELEVRTLPGRDHIGAIADPELATAMLDFLSRS